MTEPHGPLEMAQFHVEAGQCRQCGDDATTAVTGMVTGLLSDSISSMDVIREMLPALLTASVPYCSTVSATSTSKMAVEWDWQFRLLI